MTLLHPMITGIVREHRIVRVVPNDQIHLGYGLAVPRGWAISTKVGQGESGSAAPLVLGVFTENEAGGSPTLTVSCTVLPEVDIEAWIRGSHAATSWTLTRFERVYADRTRYICSAIRQDADPIHRERHMFVDGGRLWCVSAASLDADWPAVASLMQTSLYTFDLLHPTYDERLEPRTTWSARGRAFDVPASWWTASSCSRGVGGGSAYLVEGGQVVGMLRARFRERTERDRAALERELYDELHRSPLSPRGPIMRTTEPRDGNEDSVHWEAGLTCEADLAGSPVSVHVAVRRLDDDEVELRVITPREQDHPMAWMRGRRAFAIAAQTAVVNP